MFRQIKEMKAMLEGAPEMAEPALPMSVQAQRLAMAAIWLDLGSLR